MAEAFNFELVSPERLLVSEKVEEVVIPAALGELTVLANHAPTMTTIRPGLVTVRLASGQVSKYVVFGGFADILPSGLTLLAEAALPLAEVDAAVIEARSAAVRAEIDKTSDLDRRVRLEDNLNALANLGATLATA